MSSPSLVQADPFQLYTLTWPALLALPSFRYAPIATVVPSEDKETLPPDRSSLASPSMSSPSLVQADPFQLYTLTCPALLPLPSF